MYSLVLIILGSTLSLILFQNCGGPASGSKSQASTDDKYSDKQLSAEASYHFSDVSSSSLNASAGSSSSSMNPSADWRQSSLLLTTYGAYSPHLFNSEDLIFGGWVSSADPIGYLSALNAGANPQDIWGPDKIFKSTIKESVNATTQTVKLAFALKGYHVNDPTVVAPQSTDGIDRSRWLYMYYTMLDNRLAENCRKSGRDLMNCPELFMGHDIGMASSVDGGNTWTHRAIVVQASKSGDGKGAWMPTVIKVGNELHLYYSSGSQEFSTPNLFRQRLNANGLSKIGGPQRVSISNFVRNQLYANTDVQSAVISGKRYYLMVANSGDQKRIHAFLSADGLNFRELNESPFLSTEGSNSVLLTPQIVIWGHNELSGTLSGGGGSAKMAFVHLTFGRYSASSSWEIRKKTDLFFSLP
jgi:hypothetical protein